VFRKVLNVNNRKVLQAADGDLEGGRSASSQYLSLNLDLAADTSRINVDRNIGYGLVRVIDMPAGATTVAAMAMVDTHFERELGAASVDLQFVRNDGPNAMIVAVTHNTSVSAKLQQAVTDENSQLHRNMRAAGGKPAIDPWIELISGVPVRASRPLPSIGLKKELMKFLLASTLQLIVLYEIHVTCLN
jgi:hypothetical protein